MYGYPSVPGWDGIHPALVMFPVALLLLAPVLVFASLFAKEQWRAWTGAALLTMVIGSLAAWMAAGSGHAAGQLVDKSRELEAVILRHEALGMLVRNVFTGLTALFLVLLLLPRWVRRPIPAVVRISVFAVYLAGYVLATGLLARAADAGGRLVHERGLHAFVVAPMAKPGQLPGTSPATAP